jgi:hypothetical protein
MWGQIRTDNELDLIPLADLSNTASRFKREYIRLILIERHETSITTLGVAEIDEIEYRCHCVVLVCCELMLQNYGVNP